MKKKNNIIQAATRLFADRGYDGTTTLQIAEEAGVTEPLIYYHFKGKEELFSHILETTFQEYFSRLENLEELTGTQFERIEALLDFHFRFVKEMPDEIYMGVSTCPARLRDPEHACSKIAQNQSERLRAFLTECLEKGIRSGEFNRVPVSETVEFLIALIYGLMRQRGLHLLEMEGVRDVTVDFCRRSLVKGP